MAYNNNQKRQPEQFDVERERQLYYAALSDPANQKQYRDALGPNVDLDRFLASARDAVESNPKLLAPALRQSLMFSVKKAAQQTLRPDGKQGALIPRYNSDARAMQVSWQPMLQGILHLGRQSGVLRDFTAEIVFAGEPFKFLRGDDPKIVHEWIPEIREKAYGFLRAPVAQQSDPNAPPDEEQGGGPNLVAFWDQVVAAYCIVIGPDGNRTRRAMTRSRLILLRDFSRARGGPWQSVWLDEMIIKAAVHHTMKHVDTVTKDEQAARAFRSALDQDMDADLSDDDDDVIDARVNAAPPPPALAAPNPMDKLSRFENRSEEREKVTVDRGEQSQQQPQREQEPERQERRAEPQKEQSKAPQKAETEQRSTPPEKSGPSPDQAAIDRATGFVVDIEQRIKTAIASTTNEDEAGSRAAEVVNNRAVQSQCLRLKQAYKPLYNRVLSACADPKVVNTIMGQTQTAYESFYFDLLEITEKKKAA